MTVNRRHVELDLNVDTYLTLLHALGERAEQYADQARQYAAALGPQPCLEQDDDTYHLFVGAITEAGRAHDIYVAAGGCGDWRIPPPWLVDDLDDDRTRRCDFCEEPATHQRATYNAYGGCEAIEYGCDPHTDEWLRSCVGVVQTNTAGTAYAGSWYAAPARLDQAPAPEMTPEDES